MNIKQISLACLLSAAVGAALVYKLRKPETVVKTVEKEVIKRDVVTQIKVVTKPDGTKEEVTVITDRSTENKESSKTVSTAKPNWHVSAAAKVKSISDTLPTYQLTVERRILSDIYVGVTADTSKTFGVTVGVSF